MIVRLPSILRKAEKDEKSRASEKLGFFILNRTGQELCLQEREPILLYPHPALWQIGAWVPKLAAILAGREKQPTHRFLDPDHVFERDSLVL